MFFMWGVVGSGRVCDHGVIHDLVPDFFIPYHFIILLMFERFYFFVLLSKFMHSNILIVFTFRLMCHHLEAGCQSKPFNYFKYSISYTYFCNINKKNIYVLCLVCILYHL